MTLEQYNALIELAQDELAKLSQQVDRQLREGRGEDADTRFLIDTISDKAEALDFMAQEPEAPEDVVARLEYLAAQHRFLARRALGMVRAQNPKKKAKNNYTDPELRERLKEEIMASEKGGRAGQWSARKAQMLARAYEEAGGGYLGPKTESQKSLTKWTKENWRTKDGAPAERLDSKGRPVMKRYLPDEAWGMLSEEEREATDAKKVAGSRTGEQFISNTKKAKAASKKARSKKKRRKSS